jgi:hypothetical protein
MAQRLGDLPSTAADPGGHPACSTMHRPSPAATIAAARYGFWKERMFPTRQIGMMRSR